MAKQKKTVRPEPLRGTFFQVGSLDPAEPLAQDHPLFLADDEQKRKRYRKQVIYEGAFVKSRPDEEDIEFSVDGKLMDHWHDTFLAMQDEGIEVPMPLGHTEDPEKRRATVVGSERGKDSQGRDSLFQIVEFVDPKYESLAASSNVSIFVPPSFRSGKGTPYERPIRHTAFTDYPVIPGLEPFQAIACSYDALELNMPMPGGVPTPAAPAPAGAAGAAAPPAAGGGVTLQTIAKKLGVPENLPPDQLLMQIDAKVTQLMAQKPPAPGAPALGGAPAVPATPPRSVAASHVKTTKKLRERELRDLLENGQITSAMYADFCAQYCTEKGLALSLSDGAPDDGFDSLVRTLSKNTKGAIRRGERSGPQVLALSDDRNRPEPSSVVRNAEKRAEAAGVNGNGRRIY